MKIDLRDITVLYEDRVTGCPGASAVIATSASFPMPVGFVWYRHAMRNDIEILHVFTVDHYRRNGIATALIRKIREWYPKHTITTAQANAQSRPLLKKLGFNQTANGWYWNPVLKRQRSFRTGNAALQDAKRI